MAKKPEAVEQRGYQVGFGGCFLPSSVYGAEDKRHVSIDFGPTELPEKLKHSTHMSKVAEQIKKTVSSTAPCAELTATTFCRM